ncbi:lipopolysaccharide kinase InaA family protein [Streptomyces sp. NPDC088762]|uniref:lipopolysaccharide kinase InaA family protein n=1 Tax=Streptomyces sp. NPDC088762 TaxID=3365891 RepID=UPI0037F49ECB
MAAWSDLGALCRRGYGPDPQHLLPAAAFALAELHAAGVAHGDLNSRDILVDDHGTVGFIDFESGVVLGDPAPVNLMTYVAWALAAPERFHRVPDGCRPRATPAGDQYTLAALFHRLLTGSLPRDNPPGVGPRNPPPSVPARNLTGEAAERWPLLPAVLATALSRDPAHRHPTSWNFAHGIAHAMVNAGTEYPPTP